MTLNPVERKLLEIRILWETFTADTTKRLLIWGASGTALRLIECFFEAQKHETEYSTRDLCIVLKTPFENSIQYSRTLKEALAGSYAASREELERDGIPADWQFASDSLPNSAWGFVEALRSFGGHHHTRIGHLAAVLMPIDVSDEKAFSNWLARALDARSPERLRIAVVDPAEAPRLRALTEAGDSRILNQVPVFDVLTVAQETFAREAGIGPAAVFRNQLMSMVALIDKGSADQVRAKSVDAFEFARRQGWDDQQVAVAIMLAGAQLKEQRFDEAINTYRFAGAAAGRTVEAGHPMGRKLLVQTMFGEAGVQLAAGRTAEAVRCYDSAAETAASIPDLLLLIEALRMSAFCCARMDDTQGALVRGRQVLHVGRRVRSDMRNMTTLPIAATDMLRVIDPERTAGIGEIRAAAEAKADAALDRAETCAATLEQAQDRAAFENVERELEAGRAAAWREADTRLQTLVTGGSADFRRAFKAGRALLGIAWPLGSEAATGPTASAPVRPVERDAAP
jgi:hypothetical protein